MTPEIASQATGQPTEQPTGDVGEQPTNPNAPSTGQAGAQEQTTGAGQAAVSPELIEQALQSREVQARIYQQAQSMKDKELAREREAQRQREELQRLSKMDDTEYGRHIRTQQNRQLEVQEIARSSLRTVMQQMQDEALKQVGDAKARTELQGRIDRGDFASMAEFFAATVKAEIDRQVTHQTARKEGELRNVITKEAQALALDQIAPQLGSGSPASGTKKLTGVRGLSRALAIEREKARKG